MSQLLLFFINIAVAVDKPITTGGPGTTVKITNPLLDIKTVQELLKRVANYMFGFGVAISVIMVLYGAFQILLAGRSGGSGGYQKGIDTIKYAALGLAIMMLAYGFASLVANILGIRSGGGANQAVPTESRGYVPQSTKFGDKMAPADF